MFKSKDCSLRMNIELLVLEKVVKKKGEKAKHKLWSNPAKYIA